MKARRLLIIFILLLLLSLLPQCIWWINHKLIYGLYPITKLVILASVFLTSVLIVLISYQRLKRNVLEYDHAEPVILFAMGILCCLISGVITNHLGFDIHEQDTIYAYTYKKGLLKCSFFFGIISAIYFMVPAIFKLDFNIRLGRIHFWVTWIGLIMAVTVIGLDMETNRPRRYSDYGGWNIYDRIDYYKIFTLFPVIFVVLAQFVFIFNIIYAILSPRYRR